MTLHLVHHFVVGHFAAQWNGEPFPEEINSKVSKNTKNAAISSLSVYFVPTYSQREA